MNKISADISKDLKDQPKFSSDIGSKDQDHHSFELGEQSTLKKIQHFLHGNPTIVPVIILILRVTGFGFIAGGKFFSAFNLSLIVQQVTIVGILAAAQTLIILTAGIDLSVAAMMVLASVFMGKLSVEMGIPTLLAIMVGMIGIWQPTLHQKVPWTVTYSTVLIPLVSQETLEAHLCRPLQ